MGSANTFSTPIIDFSKLDSEPGTTEWELVKSEVWRAIEQYGGFQAFYRKIPEEVQEAFLNELEGLFDLPLETKMGNVSDKPFGGYTAHSSSTASKESFNISEPNIHGNIKSFCDVLLPNGKPSLDTILHSFSKGVSELEKIIRRMIFESLGMEKYLDEHMDSTTDTLRLHKYQDLQATGTKIGLVSHTDLGLLSIIYQNQVDGLEAQTRNGEWVKVKFSPNTFMVFIGESFHAWSNGRLPCLYHRVMIYGKQARYSAGWFSAFKPGYIVKAPEELVDEGHPLLFKPFDFLEFMKYVQKLVAMKSEYSLKDYCGV